MCHWASIEEVPGRRLVFACLYTNYFKKPVLKPSVTSARSCSSDGSECAALFGHHSNACLTFRVDWGRNFYDELYQHIHVHVYVLTPPVRQTKFPHLIPDTTMTPALYFQIREIV